MANVLRFHVGPDTPPFQQGRGSHGRWRALFQHAAQAPDDPAARAAFYAVQDGSRLAFALAQGPAADLLSQQLAEALWTRETAGDDWPQNLREWLSDRARWAETPAGRTAFIAGRLERNFPGGRLYLAWLGMNSLRLLDRLHQSLTLDIVPAPDEGWTPDQGPLPAGMALHAYRGSLAGLERLMIFTPGAAALGARLPDLSHAELQQAAQSEAADAPADLVLFDLRLSSTLNKPSDLVLTYRWIAPDICTLAWLPPNGATGFRVEESATPGFENPVLLAELTDTRQQQYRFSPPTTGPRYYRVTPLNQDIAGTPSDPLTVTPVTLPAPVLEPIRWVEDGGFHIAWSPIAQATGYELQEASTSDFDPETSQVIYRGEAAEIYLPAGTPPNAFYRVRAINVLYAPHNPSPWSRPRRSPLRLETPVFSRITPERLEWQAVPGAQQYAVRITPRGQDEGQGEDFLTTQTTISVADQPASYRVRAFRHPNDLRTVSEWSEAVALSTHEALPPPSSGLLPLALPVLAGTAIIALLIGLGLGIAGLEAWNAANASPTRTPLAPLAIEASATAAQLNIQYATSVVQLEAQYEALKATLAARSQADRTATHLPTQTPPPTANLTATVGAALEAALTGTAARPTATPSPTPTVRTRPSRTPTPLPTPGVSATADRAMASFED